MLSLLSLLLASGTVLRADTDQWTPLSYPDPRNNFTSCNTWPNSTLCDPDHILTDNWRAEINENIHKQVERLKDSGILYTDKAPNSCLDNATDNIQIYVILAKRIQTSNNQSIITEADLTNFGNELARKYGLDQQPCKNFVILIGIEAAKLAYVRVNNRKLYEYKIKTGKDLKLPSDLMQRVFREYNLFNPKNYMEGLNKIVDEIGEQMLNPFKDLITDLITEPTIVQAETTTVQINETQNLNNTDDSLLLINNIEDATLNFNKNEKMIPL